SVRVSTLDGVNGGFDDRNARPRGAYQWSPDGKKIAFTHSDAARTADIWIADIDTGRPMQLTNSMPSDLRRETRFIWPEITTYRSFDGIGVRGLVSQPRD